MMKNLFFLIFLFVGLTVSAQEYEVVSFDVEKTDLTARTNPRVDSNGRKCAIIKIYVNDRIAEARGSVVGDIKSVGMEKQLYVAHDSKQVELIFDNHYPLKINFMDYDIPSVTGQMTYICKLRDNGQHSVRQASGVQSQASNVVQDYGPNKTAVTHIGNNIINGHEWVDLGLPSGLKWATCNVGATSPEGYGEYFAWGETSTKLSFTVDNSRTYDKSVSQLQSEGIIDSQGVLNRRYDAASANWGGSWRMPTKEEFDELIKKCHWEWTTLNGKNGYKVTGPNGNSIFLSAAGYCIDTSRYYVGENGSYWSASVVDGVNNAYRLYFSSGYHDTDWDYRNRGRSVRLVTE